MPHFPATAARLPGDRDILSYSDIDDSPPGDDVSGIVLAGAHRGAGDDFDRVLRGPLIPVAHSPVITYPLEWLRAGGVRRATICANSETERVRARLGDGARLGIALDYFADHTPRGPAGCAHDAARRSPARTFVVVEGAMIPGLDLRALLRAHRETDAAVTVVAETDRRRRTPASGRARQPGGIYVFERRVLEGVAERGYQDIKQGLLERLHAARERMALHDVAGVSPRVLDSASYAAINAWMITEAVRRPMPLREGYLPCGEGLRHHAARVDAEACLVGPVLIGAGARIDAGAVVVGPASIGAGTIVRADALVSRSVIWDHCVIGAGAIVASSVLADHSVVLAGERVITAVQLPAVAMPHEAEVVTGPAHAMEARASTPTTRRTPSSGVRTPIDFISPVPVMPFSHHRTDELPALP